MVSRCIHLQTLLFGIHRGDGHLKLKKVLELMDIANGFAYGEDTYQNKRTRSPEDDRSQWYNHQ
jgi:hypothetical protein